MEKIGDTAASLFEVVASYLNDVAVRYRRVRGNFSPAPRWVAVALPRISAPNPYYDYDYVSFDCRE